MSSTLEAENYINKEAANVVERPGGGLKHLSQSTCVLATARSIIVTVLNLIRIQVTMQRCSDDQDRVA